jgi:hypothetical protein
MHRRLTILLLLVLCAPLAACSARLNERDVREFIDQADAAARKRFAPEICGLRGKDFVLRLKFQGDDRRQPPSDLEINRRTFCVEAGKFSFHRHYQLERKSLDVDLAADRRTARVTADYVETMAYFEPDRVPASPFDFSEFQILTTREESVVGIESGDIVFLSTEASVQQALVPKNSIEVPTD